MKKHLLSIPAVALAIGITAFVIPSKKAASSNSYYFRFIGTIPQQTSNKNYWMEISATEYYDLDCFGTRMGCKIEVDGFYTWQIGGRRELIVDVPVINNGTSNEAAIVDNWVVYDACNSLSY